MGEGVNRNPCRYLHEYFKPIDKDKVAVILKEGRGLRDSTASSLSYDEVDNFANEVKDKLPKGGGGGFVGVVCKNRLVIPSIQLGIMRAGQGFFCMDPHEWKEDLLRGRRNMGLKLLIMDNSSFQDGMAHCMDNVLSSEMMVLRNHDHQPVETLHLLTMTIMDEEDMGFGSNDKVLVPFRFAYAMQTTGTTGKKKLVLVPHKCICPNIEDFINRVWKMETKDVVWGCSPPTFDPSIVDIYCAFGVGGTIAYFDETVKNDGSVLGIMLFHTGVTVIQTTPSILRRIRKGLINSVYFISNNCPLKVLALGGEKCLEKSELKDFIKPQLYKNMRSLVNLYGLTEMSCWASFGRIDLSDDQPIYAGEELLQTTLTFDQQPSTSDHPAVILESTTRICTIIDSDGKVVQDDYSSENENQGFKKVEIHTGDVCKIHRYDGSMEIVSRIDNGIAKRAGMKIPLCLIAEAARKTGLVKFAECVELNGKILLIVDLNKENRSVFGLQEDVISAFVPNLALDIHPSFYPNNIIAVKSIPLNPNGKLDLTKVLKQAVINNNKCSAEYRITKEIIRNVLHPFWLQVTCRRGIPLEDILNEFFYEVGGKSSTAYWLIETVFTALGSYGTPKQEEITERVIIAIGFQTFDNVCQEFTNAFRDDLRTAEVSVLEDDNEDIQGAHAFRPTEAKKPRLTMCSKCSSGNNPPMAMSDLENDSRVAQTHETKTEETLQIPLEVLHLYEFNLNMCVDAEVTLISGERCAIPELAVVASHAGIAVAVDCRKLRNLKKGKAPYPNSVLWSHLLSSRIQGPALPAKDGASVYFACHDGTVVKVSAFNGQVDSVFQCEGQLQKNFAITPDGSKIIVLDQASILYCLENQNLHLLWTRKIEQTRGTKSCGLLGPTIQGSMILILSNKGIEKYSLVDGQEIECIKPLAGLPCTAAVIWNTSAGKRIVIGLQEGFEVRSFPDFSNVYQDVDPTTLHNWMDPVIHTCKITGETEIILVSFQGKIIRLKPTKKVPLGFEPHKSSFPSTMILESTPGILCSLSNTNGEPNPPSSPPSCYFLHKPRHSQHFLLQSLDHPAASIPILQGPKFPQENFSRPLVHKDLILVGGRDNKLHIMVCKTIKTA